MFNNSPSPISSLPPHTVPQNPLHTSEHSARPLMCPGFPNAKTIFNRFLLPPNTLLRQEFGHELSPFDFVWWSVEFFSDLLLTKPSGRISSPNFQQFLAPSPDWQGLLTQFVPIIPNTNKYTNQSTPSTKFFKIQERQIVLRVGFTCLCQLFQMVSARRQPKCATMHCCWKYSWVWAACFWALFLKN